MLISEYSELAHQVGMLRPARRDDIGDIPDVLAVQPGHSVVTVELVEPDSVPAFVRIGWPLSPTVVDPKSFGDTAPVIVRLFSTAHVALAGIKARRRL